MKLLLDAGHNASVWGHPLTPGKRSPEIPPGFYEGDFNRQVCQGIVDNYDDSDVLFLNPGPIGKSLKDRVVDINRIHKLEKSILCSVHANAASNSGWGRATGTTAFVHPRASETSKMFATLLLEHMHKYTGLKNRGVKTARFAILKCAPPAVLLETLFMDNKKDIEITPSLVSAAIYVAYVDLVSGR